MTEMKKGDFIRFAENVDSEIKVVTDKAFLITVDHSSYAHESKKDVWVPKSICEIYKSFPYKKFEGIEPEGNVHMMKSLPEWFVRKNFR